MKTSSIADETSVLKEILSTLHYICYVEEFVIKFLFSA